MKLSERYQEKLQVHEGASEVDLNGVLLQLEVTNYCNHQCYFCPNKTSSRRKMQMDFTFAKKIIRECAEFLKENKQICFHMNGEPLLYSKLPELIEYSKKCGYVYTFVTTNGSMASKTVLSDLFEAGLDSIKFSINAGTEETYTRIHGKNDFEKVLNAVKFAYQYRLDHKKAYKIFVSCVGIKENYQEIELLQKLVEPYSDEVVFYYPCGYAGQNNALASELRVDLSKLPVKSFEIRHSMPCNALWNSINVTCEGYLSICCSEADNRLIIEDLNKRSVKNAWLGEKMNRIRNMHLAGEIEKLPCYACIEGTVHGEESLDEDLFRLSFEKRKRQARIKKDIVSINYGDTYRFFEKRAQKFQESNPYSTTMYQDGHPEIARERNEQEISKLLPKLHLNSMSKVLDIACGIGRWSDAIKEEIAEYCGIDFSAELIRIAEKRNQQRKNRKFMVGAANDIEKLIKSDGDRFYNRVLMIGILMYLNDIDVKDVLSQVEKCCMEHTILCIREPIGIKERLTLNHFYSNELKECYNAIYRTKKELYSFFEESLLDKGFRITQEGYLFSETSNLNNRKETAQYYYILER